MANGITLAADKGKTGNTYILSGEYYSVKTMVDMMSKITGKKQIRVILPLWFAKMTAPLAELYYRIKKQKPLFTGYSLYTLQCNSNFSSKKAQEELGYTKKFSLKQTIQDTFDWCKANGQINRKKAANHV